jgi:hypothetical protein
MQEDVRNAEANPRKKGHHQEGDDPMKKKMTSSRRDAPQKPDRPHIPEQVSRCKRWFRRLALPHSVHAEDGMGSARMQLDRRTVWCIVLGNRETGGKVMLER